MCRDCIWWKFHDLQDGIEFGWCGNELSEYFECSMYDEASCVEFESKEDE